MAHQQEKPRPEFEASVAANLSDHALRFGLNDALEACKIHEEMDCQGIPNNRAKYYTQIAAYATELASRAMKGIRL